MTQKGFFSNGKYRINLSTTNVPHHIETTQLICSISQLTGFHMMGEHWSLMG